VFTGDNLPHHILQIGVPWGDNALICQVIQGFTQDVDRLCRQFGDALRLQFQFCLGSAIAESEIEQLKYDPLLFETGGFRQCLDRSQFLAWEVLLENVTKIVEHSVPFVNEKLPLGLKITELEHQVSSRRAGVDTVNCTPFGRT